MCVYINIMQYPTQTCVFSGVVASGKAAVSIFIRLEQFDVFEPFDSFNEAFMNNEVLCLT